MSVSRGDFLKSLGKSLPGMLLGGGATAAKQVLDKVAAIAGESAPEPLMAGQPPRGAVPAADYPAFLESGPRDGNRVALTFDDGPVPGVTDRILDELQRRGLHATFFMIGRQIWVAPELARRVFAEGHTIANHSFTHPRLADLSDAQALDELRRTQDVIAEVINMRPVWFRPPYGSFRRDQAPLAQSLGLRVVLWNTDPKDWSNPGSLEVAARVKHDVKAGSIIVCHDTQSGTADALPAILDHFAQSGISQVSLDEMFR